jgi:hypothetical protein
VRAAAVLGLAALAICGCALSPEVDATWGRWVERRAASPPLLAEPPADLPAPENLRATSGGFRSVRLEWDPVLAGAVGGYAVERSFLSDGPFERIAVTPGRFATLHVDEGEPAEAQGAPGLDDGATAYYRVRAFAASGHLAAAVSPVVVATTAPVPGPPLELRAYSHQPRVVPLSWSAPDDATVVGYVVERSPSSRGPFEPIAHLEGRDETRWIDRGLGDLRVLHYRVAGVNAGGARGRYSEVVRAVTKPEPLPPYRLRAARQGLGANRIEWEPNVEADLAGYRLLRRRSASDGTEVVASLAPDETTAVDDAVAADESVSYSLVAVARDGLESAPAPSVALTSAGYALTARTLPEGVGLRWDPRPDEGWERARIHRTWLLRTREIGVVEGSEFVDSDVVPGRSYRYTVVLERGDASRAPPSTPVEVRIPES